MEELKEKIIGLYHKYKELESIVESKNKELVLNKEKIVGSSLNKDIDELEKVLVNIYVDTVIYNKDLQIAFYHLFLNIETYEELSTVDLPKEIKEFYSQMKKWAPKRTFVVEKGVLVETETGVLEKAREEFIKSDFFKNLLPKEDN